MFKIFIILVFYIFFVFLWVFNIFFVFLFFSKSNFKFLFFFFSKKFLLRIYSLGLEVVGVGVVVEVGVDGTRVVMALYTYWSSSPR